MEARERCLEQQRKKMLESHCREENQRRAPVRNLVADAEKRIADHEKRAPRRVPAFGASNDKYVIIYKLVNEGYNDEYVSDDYSFYHPKPEHLKTHDKRWPSLSELKKRGMKQRRREYGGRNKNKEREPEDKCMKTVDGAHR